MIENENQLNPTEAAEVVETEVVETINDDFVNFDDAAEKAKEDAAKQAQIEADKDLPPDPDAILEVRHLKKHFVLKKTMMGKPLSTLKAVDDVSFKINPGETLGIVGESGCGKTTMGRAILKLHQPTGGQRQRICIARALTVAPKFVVCDEPVSALDVSIQAQIINLLKEIQKERKLTYLFISHDLSVVKYISDKIGVMYLGSMVEFGGKNEIFGNPMHPYTKALFSAVPNPDPDAKVERIILKGDIPSPANPPKGCKFHTRCPKAMEICKHIEPEYREYEPGHFVACHCCSQEK